MACFITPRPSVPCTPEGSCSINGGRSAPAGRFIRLSWTFAVPLLRRNFIQKVPVTRQPSGGIVIVLSRGKNVPGRRRPRAAPTRFALLWSQTVISAGRIKVPGTRQEETLCADISPRGADK